MKNWTHEENESRGFVNFLSDFLSNQQDENKIQSPDFNSTKKLYLFSDYSGDLKESKLVSYSILIIDEESFQTFLSSHKSFWQEQNLENRIIDYKRLNDKARKNALYPFLQLSNSLNGLLFTVIISKELKSIYHEEKPEHIKQSLVSWSSKKAHEKLLRIRDFILLILLGLGKEGQDVLWVTDNDDIVANTNQLSSLNKFMKETLLKHLDYRLGNFSIITLSDDSEERTLEKLCSIPDLVAGALIDFLGDYENENKMPKNVGDVEPPINHEKMKVNPITNWLSKDENLHDLNKVTITIKKGIDEEGLAINTFRFPEFYYKVNL